MVYAWTDRWVRILTSMQTLSRETRNLVHTLTRTARVGLFVINGGVITKVSSASRSVSSAGCVRELCMVVSNHLGEVLIGKSGLWNDY